jgi:tRNA 2-selenouridine synthase
MNCCQTIRIDPPREERIERLLRDYAGFPAGELQRSIENISKRLGGKDTQDTLEALQAGDFRKVTDITLAYYDKGYDFSMARRNTKMIKFVADTYLPELIAPELAEFAGREIKFL